MESQSQIKRCLSEPEGLAAVRALLAQGEEAHRTGLERRLCERFGFCDGRGEAQTAGCLKALGELSRAGHFALPAPRSRPSGSTPRRLGAAVAAPQGVPSTAGAVLDLNLVRVDSDERMRIWNELMLREHPCGAGPLVGPQLRYLIGSAHGWPGWYGLLGGGDRLARPRYLARLGRGDPARAVAPSGVDESLPAAPPGV